jgi:mono/diheme cytochrome c family protein
MTMGIGVLGAITAARGLAIGVALVIGVAFVIGAAYAAFRRPRRPGTPDIPPAMRPGPTDQELERSRWERSIAWGAVLVLFMALWVPIVWLQEPKSNAQDQIRLNQSYVDQGSHLVQLSSPDNPAGYGCVRCHGADLRGGFNVYNNQRVAVPNLRTVCGGPNVNPPHSQITSLTDIVNTIAQGRGDMPSWSVKFAGALDDDQIQAIVDYLLSIQDPSIKAKDNVCLNPIKP